jgi:hypothetical protein
LGKDPKIPIVKKKNYFTGSVFQFYVQEIEKYCFCKFFDFKHLSDFHGLLAQVFDFFSEKEENALESLIGSDWLFGARSMYRWPNLRKESGWKYLGIINSSDDGTIPDFKSANVFPYIVEDESKITDWSVVRNLTDFKDCNYDAIKHLETRVLTVTSLNLSYRTGMEYCRKNNLEVRDYYDLSNTGVHDMYLQMINVPMYSDIPKEIRGKGQC